MNLQYGYITGHDDGRIQTRTDGVSGEQVTYTVSVRRTPGIYRMVGEAYGDARDSALGTTHDRNIAPSHTAGG